MPEKMGNTFSNTSLVSPLNANPGKSDPGPPITNSPLIKPSDPTGYLDEPTKPGTKTAIAGGKGRKGSATGS
jgi:hypothetical protein